MPAPPIPPNVVDLSAPLLFGVLWNWTLYGVLIVQFYVYIHNFPDDRKFLKLIVFAIFLLETLQTALSGGDVYYWFGSGFGNMDHLLDPYAASFDVPIIGSIVSGVVQFFFVYRVWVLSQKKSWWYCVLIAVCSGIDTIGAFAGGIYAHVSKTFISGRSLQIIVLTWLIGNTVTDLLIVTAMVFYLTRRRNAESFSNHALVKIMRLTVETNILTTTTSVIALLMVAILPHKFYYTCPTAFLGKLYSNTLLVSLNNRISIRQMSSGSEALPTSPSRARPASTAKGHLSIVQLELDKPQRTFEGRKQSDESAGDEGQQRVIYNA